MSLADRFAEAGHEELNVAGNLLRQVWRRRTGPGTVRIDRVSVTDARPQGIVIDADCELAIAGHESHRIVIWSHTAPETVEIEVTGPTELRVWNVWQDAGMTHAWLGDAAMHVQSTEAGTRLACRDGHDDDPGVLPGDLVVEITVAAPG